MKGTKLNKVIPVFTGCLTLFESSKGFGPLENWDLYGKIWLYVRSLWTLLVKVGTSVGRGRPEVYDSIRTRLSKSRLLFRPRHEERPRFVLIPSTSSGLSTFTVLKL